MNRAFHTGVVLAVAIHMVCGCCLHHAHAAGGQADVLFSVDATSRCDHHGQQHEGQPGDHRSGDQDCDGDQCVFTLLELGSVFQLMDGADCLSFICVVPSLPEVDGIDSVGPLPHHRDPSIPLHLLNQALLL